MKKQEFNIEKTTMRELTQIETKVVAGGTGGETGGTNYFDYPPETSAGPTCTSTEFCQIHTITWGGIGQP